MRGGAITIPTQKFLTKGCSYGAREITSIIMRRNYHNFHISSLRIMEFFLIISRNHFHWGLTLFKTDRRHSQCVEEFFFLLLLYGNICVYVFIHIILCFKTAQIFISECMGSNIKKTHMKNKNRVKGTIKEKYRHPNIIIAQS